jgi:nicotinamide mononucleotide transporter PnuC
MRFSAIYGEGVDRIEVLRKIQKENTFRFWWYIIFGLAAIICLAIWPASWLSCIKVFVLMINIDLVARGKVVGIYVGILDCLIYVVICSASGLWGEIIKTCCINIPLNIVAIISWTKNIKAQSKNKVKSQTIEIKRLKPKDYAIWLTVFVVTAVLGYFGLGLLNTTSLVISCVSLAIGVLSKTLSGLRYMESYQLLLVG